MILRNFLYLDTSMLDDYLSTLEGYVIESGELTENKTTSISGKGSVKIIEAGRGVESETGKVSRIKLTDAGNFQRLYELLEDQKIIQFLEVFDDTIWNSIRRNEILEIQGLVSLTEKYSLLDQVGNITPFIDLMNTFGQTDLIDKEGMKAINGMKAVSEMNTDNEVPVLINLDFSDKYQFATKISKEYLRADISKLDGEVTIIGKVLKIIPQGQEYEMFSMVAGLDAIMKTQNRKQRRDNNKDNTQEIADKLKGPAIILIPLAIYR